MSIVKHFYVSFINGWYQKANDGILKLDDKCFGQWIVHDFSNLDSEMVSLITAGEISTAV